MNKIELPPVLTDNKSYLNVADWEVMRARTRFGKLPDGSLRRALEVQGHQMVLGIRTEIRKFCPKYAYAMPDGGLDFRTECRSGQALLGDEGQPTPLRRPGLCETCQFYGNWEYPERAVDVTQVTPVNSVSEASIE